MLACEAQQMKQQTKMNMKETEQRIAIAEACGYEPFTSVLVKSGCRAWTPPEGGVFVYFWELPNYHDDLNAISEAVTTVCGHMKDYTNMYGMTFEVFTDRYKKFIETLFKIVKGYELDYEMELDAADAMLKATPTQRAEALLKTIGKWVEP